MARYATTLFQKVCLESADVRPVRVEVGKRHGPLRFGGAPQDISKDS